MKETNVLIVDDSAFMRKSLSLMLESDPSIKIVATARNGQEAIEKIKLLKPDVVTMDIEMPIMDGLTALGIIMKECPVPVLMVSSLTTEGADATVLALSKGAVDFIPKQLSYVSLDITKIKEALVEKIKCIAGSRGKIANLARRQVPAASDHSLNECKATKPFSAVVIGVSTGGPNSLFDVVPRLPSDFPIGIAIVQHMPPKFTKSLADRLNDESAVVVKEAEDGELFKSGHVYVAPGGQHMIFRRILGEVRISLTSIPAASLYKPCVDVTMLSAVNEFQKPLLGVIMTGMGKDGLLGLREIKKRGGNIIAQNEGTCIVYGMPRVVVEDGIADSILPLQNIADALMRYTKYSGSSVH